MATQKAAPTGPIVRRRTVRPQVKCGPSLTEQAHASECDINVIMKEYYRTGLVKHMNRHPGQFDDVTVTDYQEAMFTLKNAHNLFTGLPANIRKRFHNEPAEFLEFVGDPKNVDEMRKLGIMKGVDGLDITGTVTDPAIKAAHEQDKNKQEAKVDKKEEKKE